MKEIVVISGKGGTGKTTVLAVCAMLSKSAVMADCDVDAPNLHMLLRPSILSRESFTGSQIAVVNESSCTLCGECVGKCRFDALRMIDGAEHQQVRIDDRMCEGCAVCANLCPESAVEMRDREVGEWFLSETKCGTMVHALLEPGAENSGRLVAMVKQMAKRTAKDEEVDLILVDGPPGIGCPVISALAGADIVVIVSEPTISGLSDFKRVADLSNSFDLRGALIINKSDLNDEMSAQLLDEAANRGITHLGSVPYDENLMMEMARGEWECTRTGNPAVAEISRCYEKLLTLI